MVSCELLLSSGMNEIYVSRKGGGGAPATDRGYTIACGPQDLHVVRYLLNAERLREPAYRQRKGNLLLRTERGRKSLAANYISQPSLRRHLTDIAVTLDPVTQQKFLDELTVEMDRRQ